MSKVRVVVLVAALLSVAAFATYRLMNSRTFQLFGELTHRVETDRKLVALTFDDGPTPEATTEVLGILARENIKATFFLVGRDVEAHPESAAAIVDAGHEVGNHSYSHRRMIFIPPGEAKSELVRTELALRAVGAQGDLHFRPPYGKKLVGLPWALRSMRLRSVTWDVEPESYSAVASSTDAIVSHVVQNTKPGSIILLHPMVDQEMSRAAIAPIVQQLKSHGFEFVTVSELLSAG